MKKIKIGVLGVSNHLLKRIVLPLKHTQYCELVAIASRDNNKSQKFAKEFNIPKSYNSYDDLLKDKDIEMVYIPLPNHLHTDWIKKASIAGKNILCEKPLALNAIEAQTCTNIAKSNNIKLMEAFMYQFHPLWIHIKNIIRTNQIGKIKYIHTSFAYNNPQIDNIRNIKEFGGGSIMDIGCYAVSVSRFILNKEPHRVISLCEEHNTFKTDVLSTAILDFKDCRATFSVSTLSHANQSVEIVGTSGIIKVFVPFNTYVDTKSEILISTAQGDRTVIFDICDQYGLMFDAFSKTIIKNEETPISLQDSINNMKVIDALFKSAKTDNWEIIQ